MVDEGMIFYKPSTSVKIMYTNKKWQACCRVMTSLLFLKAKLYYILLDDDSNTNEKWVIGYDEFSISHKRVFKISLKRFYTEITKQEKAYEELREKLPFVIKSYLSIQQPS